MSSAATREIDMGVPDVLAQGFMRNPAVFADAFNFAIYNGRQIIQPEALQEIDPTLLFEGDSQRDSEFRAMKLFRDVVKLFTMYQDERTSYLLMGIENQASVDWCMPLRVMIYDALAYYRQMKVLKKKTRQSGDELGNAFLTGIPENAVLYPVITLVINFSAKPWMASKTVHGLFSGFQPELLKVIPDHHFLLIDPHSLSKRKCRKLRTDLQIVCECLRLSRHRNELQKMVKRDLRFRQMDELTAELIKSVLSIHIELEHHNNGVVDMCQAIEEWAQDEREKGEKQGFEKGEKQGFEKGVRSILMQMAEQGIITKDVADSVLTQNEAVWRQSVSQ